MGNPGPVLIGSFPDLKAASRDLAGAERYFIDTEFDNRKLCLVQVSRGAQVYLVDTLRLTALEPLAEAIGRPGAEWVLHDGVEDVALLRGAMKIGPSLRFFDTQVAWGLLGPEYPVSLAYLLYRILGIRSAKEHQAGDWTGRPLSEGQLQYAAKDVEHLPAIREWTAERLAKLDRLALLHEASAEYVSPDDPEPVAMEDYRNAWQLDAAGQAALRHLIDWHNGLSPAEKRDAPHPRNFLPIATLLPESGAELAKIRGVPFEWARRHGDSFTGKLIRASAGVSSREFTPLEPPPYDTFERILAEGWIRKAAAEVSAELGVAPELAFPGRLLRAMTRAVVEKGKKEAAADALAGWRGAVLREPFLAKCAASRDAP